MSIEIGGIKLNRVHRLATQEQAALVAHSIPGLEGNVIQDLGRTSVYLRMEGIFYGLTALDDLEALRALYKKREPVDFLAEIVGESYFSQVMITRFEVTEAAGRPDELDYVLHLMEYVEPPEPSAAPDLTAVDASILDDAKNFMAAATLPDLMSSPNISNPLGPLGNALDGVTAGMAGLTSASDKMNSLFGDEA